MTQNIETLENSHKVWLTTLTLLAFMCAAMVYFFSSNHSSRSSATLLGDRVASLVSPPKPLSDFHVVSTDEQPFTARNLAGKWTFIVFGFTYCPDICPTTLSVLTEVRELLSREISGAADVNFILVTVDPQRDTVAALKQYVEHFDSHFLGLSGVGLQIRNLANQLNASFEITKDRDSDNYSVSHSASLYLIDPQARHYATYAVPLDATFISERFNVFKRLYAASIALH